MVTTLKGYDVIHSTVAMTNISVNIPVMVTGNDAIILRVYLHESTDTFTRLLAGNGRAVLLLG